MVLVYPYTSIPLGMGWEGMELDGRMGYIIDILARLLLDYPTYYLTVVLLYNFISIRYISARVPSRVM